MIFRWFRIISACLAVALPMGTLFYTLMYMKTGGASGIPLAYSILFAPIVFGIGLVSGAILQGIYNFVIAKSLFTLFFVMKMAVFLSFLNKKRFFID